MKIHMVTQNEAAWYILRAGKVTASEAEHLLTPEFAIRKGETPKTYLYRKVAETLRGRPLEGFTSFETEQGAMREDEARGWFAFNYEDQPIKQVGFCEYEDGLPCGCSPDALLGEEGGLELKCPQDVNHIRYLMEGRLPKDYAVQVHFSMFVTGRPWWMFLSYHHRFPKFILRVERDESIIAVIRAAVTKFTEELTAALAKVRSLG
jgi:hypothetical protein